MSKKITVELDKYVTKEVYDEDGRYVFFQMKIDSVDYMFANIYAPTKDKVSE